MLYNMFIYPITLDLAQSRQDKLHWIQLSPGTCSPGRSLTLWPTVDTVCQPIH